MVCFNPNQGFEKKGLTKNGKFEFTYHRHLARTDNGNPVRRTVPCRYCQGCRNDSAREWAVKLCHEANIHITDTGLNCAFVTLTYNDKHMPLYGALSYFDHWQSFLKRLRERLSPLRIRYFVVGEYGELNLRPHYHVIIFGYDFPDKVYLETRDNNVLYRSPFLESLWTVPKGQPYAGESYGYSSIGSVSYASLCYVARYSLKKNIGASQFDGIEEYVSDEGEILQRPALSKRYLRFNRETGEPVYVPGERHFHSNKPGIAKQWFDSFALTDLYPKDYTHLPNGRIVRAPVYYDRLLEKVDPVLLESIKKSRQDYRLKHASEFTPERLNVKKEIFDQRMQSYKRELWRFNNAT